MALRKNPHPERERSEQSKDARCRSNWELTRRRIWGRACDRIDGMTVQDSRTSTPPRDAAAALALLRWYVEMGVDEAIGDIAPNRLLPAAPAPALAPPPAVVARPSAPATRVAPPGTFAESLPEAALSAPRPAPAAHSIPPLAALAARWRVLGGALPRWGPPEGGVVAGGPAASAVLAARGGIPRLGGRWFELAVPGLDTPVPTLPMFHPAFLLRTPERKREAWRDLLALRARLDELLAADDEPPNG